MDQQPALDLEKKLSDPNSQGFDEKKDAAAVSDVFGQVEQEEEIYEVTSWLRIGIYPSNLYLGLKSGFTFGPQLFGGIFGFLLLKAVSKLPSWAFGGYFGEKENVTVQTAATAAGGLGIIYVSGIPAMYQLGLLSPTPKEDFGKLIALTFVSAFYGMMFAIPLRKWYILKQKLVFPTPAATALTIRALHSGPAGMKVAKQKGISLAIAFLASITLRVVSGYGIRQLRTNVQSAHTRIAQWHPFWWLASWGWRSVIGADNWGFFWENTPAFYGAGIITGVNASLSVYIGGLVCWGLIGPILMRTGTTSAIYDNSSGYNIISYNKMDFGSFAEGVVSPRYWLLWPGVLLMLLVAFTDLLVDGKVIYVGFRNLFWEAKNKYRERRGLPPQYTLVPSMEDPAKPEEQVPVLWWGTGLIIAIIVTVIVLDKKFDILLGFCFSFIGVMCSGATDINPVSTVAKTSQVIFGGATHGQFKSTIIVTPPPDSITRNIGALRVNLLAGVVSGAAAAQTGDMTGDLKTGHLLKASPRHQFIAQGFGALCSVFLSTGLFVLFSEAYPCIIGIPSVAAWSAVAQATTSVNGLPLPTTSAIFSLILALSGVAMTIIKKRFVDPRYHIYFPNLMAFGLSFTLPPGQSQYGLAMAVSSVAAYFWKKRRPSQYDIYAFPIAAGMMAGEGIGGVLNALLVMYGDPPGSLRSMDQY
ncbi:hypothetical protein RQP46_005147 [Phenoliferia psychrophenolica]